MEDGYHSINTPNNPDETITVSESHRSRVIKRCLALTFVGLAVLDWVALAEVLQKLQTPDENGESYNKPMLLCFCIKTAYMIAYPIYFCLKCTPLGGEGRRDPEPFSNSYLFTRACALNLMGYISGYTWYMSLPITSVSANTAIYMCACAAVFLISIPVLREKITVIKVLSLLICCTGIVLVSVFSEAPHPTPHNSTFTENLVSVHAEEVTNQGSTLGYVLVIVSMFLYATYEVFYGKWLQTDQDKHPAMTSLKLVGYLGVTTPILFTIPLLIWHFSGWETMELPSSDLMGIFLISILLDALFNIFLLLAISLSNPTLASVGQSLALPGSVLADYVLHHFLLPYPALIGAGCVTVGFCGFVYEELKHQPEEVTPPRRIPEEKQGLLDASENEDSEDYIHRPINSAYEGQVA